MNDNNRTPTRRISIAEIMEWRGRDARPNDWIQGDLDRAIAEQTKQGAKRLDEAWAEYERTFDPEVPQTLGEY